MSNVYFDDNTMRQALADLNEVANILAKTADSVPDNIDAGVGTVPMGQLMQTLLQNAGNLVEISGGFQANYLKVLKNIKKKTKKQLILLL